ncbi:transposable element Tc3 transposase [Trichonephila clavipes]|nr:transposable element Tc3 transposase [Trichonephila clavipes]
MLGRRIAARQPLPACLPELRRALLDEWCNIPQDQIDNLILSMPSRYETECRAGDRTQGKPGLAERRHGTQVQVERPIL